MDNTMRNYYTPIELRQMGLEALYHSLGAANMARYISQCEQGTGDYTREKAALWEGITLDDIMEQLQTI